MVELMSHDLNSVFLYIHPTTAIIGYAFVIISLILIAYNLKSSPKVKPINYQRISIFISWFFNLLGIITGMLWAQLAWGSYWSWDPKETVTLIIFILVCLAVVAYEKGEKKITFIILTLALISIIVNVLITLGNYGLHSYGEFIFNVYN